MSVANALLVAFGGNAALLLVLGFLGRSLIKHWLDRDVSNFRDRLDRAADAHRSQLERLTFEHQTRFSRLHEARIETLAETYRLLVRARDLAEYYLNPMTTGDDPPKAELYKGADAALVEYYLYFDSRRLYLSSELCGKLERFAATVRKTILTFETYRNIPDPTPEVEQKKTDLWISGWNSFKSGEVRDLRVAIESEFRQLLDPSSPNSTPAP